MKKVYKSMLICLLTVGSISAVSAREAQPEAGKGEKHKKAWEFGLGWSIYQFDRIGITNFYIDDADLYHFDLKIRHTVHTGHLYIARELSNHFYIDFQGTLGATSHSYGNDGKYRLLGTAGLGIQWRLGEYFRSKYIDPYLRVGGAYMYKGFNIIYGSVENISSKEMQWLVENIGNKEGADRRHMFPVSAGIGVNMWFGDHWGVGLQGDYLFMPYRHVPNSMQGTVRIMYRLGGKSKKPVPEIRHIEKEVERIIEKRVEVPVEKIVTVQAPMDDLYGLFNNIHFDFDRSDIVAESAETIDRIAKIMLQDTTKRFLISGFTDIRGSQAYNQGLSERRAREVKDALIERGVPREMLKSRGAASRIALAPYAESHRVRRGDRKVTVELITNDEFWDFLTRAGF